MSGCVREGGKEEQIMKRAINYVSIFSLVMCVGLMATPAEALLQVMGDTEKVVFDDTTEKYWIWDMSMFTDRTYSQMQDAISSLDYYNITDWNMAAMEDYNLLRATYTHDELKQAFGPSGESMEQVVWIGLTSTYESYAYGWGELTPVWGVGWTPGTEIPLDYRSFIGAWVVSEVGPGGVIPEPSTMVLLGFGIIGLLILRRKYATH